MPAGSLKAKLADAKRNKRDEFYTQLPDIERELVHYREHFADKTVLLNCDDPATSNFWRFFEMQFDLLGLRRLIATHYTGPGSDSAPPSYALELVRGQDAPIRTDLAGDGDFRSPEVVAYLDQADIVVTNPPFSLFREYLAQLVEHGKRFLILGNQNAITYSRVWPLIEDGQMWLGTMTNRVMPFSVPSDYTAPEGAPEDLHGRRVVNVPAISWFTNLEIPRRHEDIPLYMRYADDPSHFPTYDDYPAIEVSKVKEIPRDYDGVMGVPITFLGKHNPTQFEIVPQISRKTGERRAPGGDPQRVNGQSKYARIMIRRVRPDA